MKFDFAIGNPPYHEEVENNGRPAPVYNSFMEEAFKIAGCVEMITPARFLFNAGQTPKAWNAKRLSDKHFKVVDYQPDASTVFPNTDIKGGVAITLRDENKNFGEIGIFTEFNELNSIRNKVWSGSEQASLSEICIGAVPYRYTELLKSEHPEWIELAGESFDLRTNALDNLHGKIFFENKPKEMGFVKIYGLYNKKRAALWIAQKYVDGPNNFGKHKLLISKANGAGSFGEALSSMIYAEPNSGHTQSFISIGSFENTTEVSNVEKYIKTKFARGLLSILRITPDMTPYKWKYVPLQDFTSNSDIDWSQSISNIDQQLYAKYGLDDKEKEFIENHVKEME
ncbi:Eco57I restriction-modification methylase domain-containing protein [Fibrobacter sp. UWEL]|uniref:Eco57I restriction-modification methylase domain-containing protein n=1 Tax=Fibrobacter sp. UWEL TaxID=1896209 RepID=UPI00091566C0|nr:Eco57I restriction-modification methylase domain-containing protein [Fibrobacter sp. UWEL]SHL49130.1 Eco57I restriction-modification methylase [Fibrobacter sp. UWEL]